jgi:hypothetical protein
MHRQFGETKRTSSGVIMGEKEMYKINTEATAQAKEEMVSWADWWEQWGDNVFDSPSVVVDIEPVYGK